ncbi:MAG TPA: pentapeptide repeat-containing protein [Actinocatenispora sp.]
MICGYLRMPSAADDPQEPQVRRTAQRVLTRHLVPGTDAYWDGLVLDLTGAVLVDLDGAGCRFVTANLAGARCEGRTVFDGATFAGSLRLAGARFAGETSFVGAVFDGPIELAGTLFGAAVSFADASFGMVTDLVFDRDAFGAEVSFRRARFAGTVRFDQVVFPGHASFDNAEFSAGVSFDHARFGAGLRMRDATCEAIAYLRWIEVAGDASFSRTVFRRELVLHQSTFHGSVRFHRASVGGTASFGKVRAAAGVGNAWPAGFTETSSGDGWVAVTPDEVSGSGR